MESSLHRNEKNQEIIRIAGLPFNMAVQKVIFVPLCLDFLVWRINFKFHKSKSSTFMDQNEQLLTGEATSWSL